MFSTGKVIIYPLCILYPLLESPNTYSEMENGGTVLNDSSWRAKLGVIKVIGVTSWFYVLVSENVYA